MYDMTLAEAEADAAFDAFVAQHDSTTDGMFTVYAGNKAGGEDLIITTRSLFLAAEWANAMHECNRMVYIMQSTWHVMEYPIHL